MISKWNLLFHLILLLNIIKKELNKITKKNILAQIWSILYTILMKKHFLVLLIVACFETTGFSQQYTEAIRPSDIENSPRPTVALVLAGGGARGFAHIPVIEIIEELGIPVDMVIGTSAGAIIGGLYSSGYSSQEIADTLLDLNWVSLFQDSTTKSFESALYDHSMEAALVNLPLNNNLSLNLGRGLLTGQNVYELFKSLTIKVPSYVHFDSLITPFRATAVDLLTGEMVVIQQGDIAEAIRASMSIPAVFEPYKIDGRYYMDGFTRNNMPVQVAHEMGYDIIIAVDLTEPLTYNVNDFDSNPLVVLNQVTALQQQVVVDQEYELANLVISPDIYEFGQIDYEKAKQIYNKGKVEVEQYRQALIELRSEIFPEFDENKVLQNSNYEQQETEMSHSFTYVDDTKNIPYQRIENYQSLQNISVDSIELINHLSIDEKYILEEFESIKNIALTDVVMGDFLHSIYNIGHYVMVSARIDIRKGTKKLVLEFVQKSQDQVVLSLGANFEGTLYDTTSATLNLSTALQFRGLGNKDSILSIKGNFINNTGIDFLYFQPLNDKVFLSTKAEANNHVDFVSSGWNNHDVFGSQLRMADLLFGVGIFFSEKHKLFNEIGLHWYDSSHIYESSLSQFETADSVQINFTADASLRYTFDTLNYHAFPTRGYYNDLKGVVGLPLGNDAAPIFFDVVSNDFLTALPIANNTSLIVSSFIGTNITQELALIPSIISKYGFSTYDRSFFPQITARNVFGIHKGAIKIDFQFMLPGQLTLIGGQPFIGITGATGNVWDSYESLLRFNRSLEWQTSAFFGIRLKDSIGVKFRVGAGSLDSISAPFIAVDFFTKY